MGTDNIPPFSTPAGAHDSAMASPPPNARTTVLYRQESRDLDWAIGALCERTSLVCHPEEKFSLAQHCVFLAPDIVGDFGSSPSNPHPPPPAVPLRHSRRRVAVIARWRSASIRPATPSRHLPAASADSVQRCRMHLQRGSKPRRLALSV